MIQQNVSEALKGGLIAGGVILFAQAALLGIAVFTTKKIVENAAAQMTGGGPVTNPVRHVPRPRRGRLSHRK